MTDPKCARPGCPYRDQYEAKCIDGQIWILTYSEMGPPDSRQANGPCPYCSKQNAPHDTGGTK
jgi:hypothetical protein